MATPFTLQKEDILVDPRASGNQEALGFLLTCVTIERTNPEKRVVFSRLYGEGITYLLNPEPGNSISSVNVQAHFQHEYYVRRSTPEFCDIGEVPLDLHPNSVWRILYNHTPPEKL